MEESSIVLLLRHGCQGVKTVGAGRLAQDKRGLFHGEDVKIVLCGSYDIYGSVLREARLHAGIVVPVTETEIE